MKKPTTTFSTLHRIPSMRTTRSCRPFHEHQMRTCFHPFIQQLVVQGHLKHSTGWNSPWPIGVNLGTLSCPAPRKQARVRTSQQPLGQRHLPLKIATHLFNYIRTVRSSSAAKKLYTPLHDTPHPSSDRMSLVTPEAWLIHLLPSQQHVAFHVSFRRVGRV